MTVKELQKILSGYNPDMQVQISSSDADIIDYTIESLDILIDNRDVPALNIEIACR